MFSNRFLFLILVLAVVGIGFGVWRITFKKAPEVKRIILSSIPAKEKPEASGKETPRVEKSEIEGSKAKKRQIFSNFRDKNGDGVIGFEDVMDQTLPLSHPYNVEARHKLSVVQYKSGFTAEELAKPSRKKYFELVESEEYLQLIKNGATFDELSNFLADNGYDVQRNPTQAIFREHFPTGEPADYEPEMRVKVSALLTEKGGYGPDIIGDFLSDPRNGAWYWATFGSKITKRDMNVRGFVEWIKDVEGDPMPSNNVPVPTVRGTVAFPEESAMSSQINTLEETQDPFIPNENGNIRQSPKETAEVRREITEPLIIYSDFKIPTEASLKDAIGDQFSQARYQSALSILNEYGPKEGLRRLKVADPEMTKMIERHIGKQQEK